MWVSLVAAGEVCAQVAVRFVAFVYRERDEGDDGALNDRSLRWSRLERKVKTVALSVSRLSPNLPSPLSS